MFPPRQDQKCIRRKRDNFFLEPREAVFQTSHSRVTLLTCYKCKPLHPTPDLLKQTSVFGAEEPVFEQALQAILMHNVTFRVFLGN